MSSPVWFITATSSGFGHAMALDALKKGHTVVATARNVNKIQDLKEQGADTMAFDVTYSKEQMDKVAKAVMDKYGRVDYLINAAGYILEGAVEETTAEEVQKQFDVNVFGTSNTIRAFLPHMRQQPFLPKSSTRATIATFSSLASWASGPSYVFYSMTKVAMASLAEGLAAELEPFGIRVTAVEPGYFETNLLKPGAKMATQTRLDAYEDPDTPTGQLRNAGLQQIHGERAGDVEKGSAVTVDMLMGTGVAKGQPLPIRMVLGTDCEKIIRAKCNQTVSLLDTWAPVAQSTAQ